MKNLQAIIEARGLTPSETARRAGLRHSTLSMILCGHTTNPSYATVRSLAGVLDVDTDSFFLDSFSTKNLKLFSPISSTPLEQKEPTP